MYRPIIAFLVAPLAVPLLFCWHRLCSGCTKCRHRVGGAGFSHHRLCRHLSCRPAGLFVPEKKEVDSVLGRPNRRIRRGNRDMARSTPTAFRTAHMRTRRER
jgi:hypothetical protein